MSQRLGVVLALLLGVGAGGLRAQAPESVSPDDDLPLPAGPWHVALEARHALQQADPRPQDVLRAVDAELTLGRPERALGVLRAHPVTDPDLEQEAGILEAAGAYGAGAFARAADLFVGAAARTSGVARGLLTARAGDALERGGRREDAALLYRSAAQNLPRIAGWLALREARVTADTAAAFRLLERVPAPARRLVPAVRGELFASLGDTARAVAVLAGAGFDGRAAALALASADTAGARQLAYRALRAGDTAVANSGIRLATGALPPRTAGEFLALGRALRREAPRRAAALVGEAVAAGDASPRTLMLWGDVLAEAGDYAASLDAFSRAAAGTGLEAQDAQFSRARTLLRLGRPLAASRALADFVAAYPAHGSTPMAMFLLADVTEDAGHHAEADSLYRLAMERWPQHEYASQARFRLAARALARADTARAVRLYRAEAEARGSQQLAARYLSGVVAAARRDSAGAQGLWASVARDDSLGYYGSLARSQLGTPGPVVPPAPRREPTGWVSRSLEELDLLDRVGFDDEARALVSWLVSEGMAADDALDLAEALAARGRSVQAINLGWRAARTLTLNHPRVLRAIYPWPWRQMVAAEAAEFGLDPYLLAAVIRQESSFDPGATSRAGARGLMQVLPGTARQAARRLGVPDWSDYLLQVPDANVHIGASHLATLLRHYRGNPVLALAAYNAGLVPAERWRLLPEARDRALLVERMPYLETRGYVRSVLRNLAIYRALYPAIGAP